MLWGSWDLGLLEELGARSRSGFRVLWDSLCWPLPSLLAVPGLWRLFRTGLAEGLRRSLGDTAGDLPLSAASVSGFAFAGSWESRAALPRSALLEVPAGLLAGSSLGGLSGLSLWAEDGLLVRGLLVWAGDRCLRGKAAGAWSLSSLGFSLMVDTGPALRGCCTGGWLGLGSLAALHRHGRCAKCRSDARLAVSQ